MANPIALSIPAFFVTMAVEWWVAGRRNKQVYRTADAVNNLHLGIGSQVVGVMSLGAMLALYSAVYAHFALTTLPDGAIWVWVAAFVVFDFWYYVYHRSSHGVAFLWATHAVHHQSEDYNLSVALRQSWGQQFFSGWFYLPMAVMGFSPTVFAYVAAFNTLYQFWIHTELVDRMPLFGKIFNTPSHHRVHHGTDAEYVDRNHAGMFIIWDKMFGTFTAEAQRPNYGTLAPVRSFEPVWANVQVWALLWQKMRAARTVKDKVLVWLEPPGWVPPGVELPPPPMGKPVDPDYALYDRPVTGARLVYVAAQFLATTAALVALLFEAANVPIWVVMCWGGAILWTVTGVGGLIDGRPWAPWAEAARLLLLTGVGAMLWLTDAAPTVGAMLFVGGLISIALGVWTSRRRPDGAVDAPPSAA